MGKFYLNVFILPSYCMFIFKVTLSLSDMHQQCYDKKKLFIDSSVAKGVSLYCLLWSFE
jgi:hypothetical protein